MPQVRLSLRVPSAPDLLDLPLHSEVKNRIRKDQTMTPTAPLDDVHANSLMAIEQLRREFRRLRKQAAGWELGDWQPRRG